MSLPMPDKLSAIVFSCLFAKVFLYPRSASS